jgi:50S ribosomal protein L16 3-hydroxylase
MAKAETLRSLGGQSVAAFLARYWHKEALLVRGAFPALTDVVDRDALFALATREDVESRLVRRVHGRYTLDDGPFRARDLQRLPPRDWTLLVQGVNLHVDAADALLRRFAFIPYTRLDDLMVSYAVPGGGVGPHVDSYDVFLLQALGRRRWRYGRQDDLRLRPGAPLRILRRFTPQHDAMLERGDMLYLPPAYAHDGVALDECMTYSIGFRAPLDQELAEGFLDCLRDTVALPGRYADPDRAPTRAPGRVDARMRRHAVAVLARVAWDRNAVDRFLGRYLTEPKAGVTFMPARRPLAPAAFARRLARDGVRLDRRTQLLYDDARYYVNGEDAPLPDIGREVLQRLADRRSLSAVDCRALPAPIVEILREWQRHGYLAGF